MDNRKIAKVIAEMVYKPKSSEKDPMFAVQLLVEELFIPEDVNSFGLAEIENYVFLALEQKRVIVYDTK